MSEQEHSINIDQRIREIKAALNGLRTGLNPHVKTIYASTPITTGKRYYDVFEQYGVHTKEELEKIAPGAFLKEIVYPNVEDGKEFGDELRFNLVAQVIVPAMFSSLADWEEEDYMAYWDEAIGQSAQTICFNDGWEYSNGCTEEFLVGLRERKELYNRKSEPLTPKEGVSLIRAGIDRVIGIGADPSKLVSNFRRVELIASRK